MVLHVTNLIHMAFRITTMHTIKNTIRSLEKSQRVPLIDYISKKNEQPVHVAHTIINSIKMFPKAYHYISLFKLNHDMVNICAIVATAQCTNTPLVFHEEPSASQLNASKIIKYIQTSFPDSQIYLTHILKSPDSMIPLLEDLIHREHNANVNLVCRNFFPDSTAHIKDDETYLTAAKTLLQGSTNVIFSSNDTTFFKHLHIPFPQRVRQCSACMVPYQSVAHNNKFEKLQYLPVRVHPTPYIHNIFEPWVSFDK